MACRHRTVRIQGNVRSSMEGRQHSSVSENIVGPRHACWKYATCKVFGILRGNLTCAHRQWCDPLAMDQVHCVLTLGESSLLRGSTRAARPSVRSWKMM
eukprot:8794309-Pyramimonas_sp.AAC.1